MDIAYKIMENFLFIQKRTTRTDTHGRSLHFAKKKKYDILSFMEKVKKIFQIFLWKWTLKDISDLEQHN